MCGYVEMAIGCLACSNGAPIATMNLASRTKLNVSGVSASRSNAARLGLNTSFFSSASCSSSSSFAGVSLRPYLNFRWMVVERSTSLMVRAGKSALGCTKRSRSRKSRARTHGFRLRMRTASGRRLVNRRRAKGRKRLVPQTNPNSGKRA